MRNARLRAVVPLHDCNGNFLRLVSHAYGADMVRTGTATAVRDFSYGNSRVKRYQETVGATPSASQASRLMITSGEMAANVLRSRTARLPEWDTKGRDSKFAREQAKNPQRPVEDFVEQAQNKIRMWPIVPLVNPQHVEWAGQA